MIEIIGVMGSIILAVATLPQVLLVIEQKHNNDMSDYFLILWIIGMLLMFVYSTITINYPLVLNYGINLIFGFIFVYYRLFGGK